MTSVCVVVCVSDAGFFNVAQIPISRKNVLFVCTLVSFVCVLLPHVRVHVHLLLD